MMIVWSPVLNSSLDNLVFLISWYLGSLFAWERGVWGTSFSQRSICHHLFPLHTPLTSLKALDIVIIASNIKTMTMLLNTQQYLQPSWLSKSSPSSIHNTVFLLFWWMLSNPDGVLCVLSLSVWENKIEFNKMFVTRQCWGPVGGTLDQKVQNFVIFYSSSSPSPKPSQTAKI